MRKHPTRWYWWLGGLIVMIAAGGCYQQAGNEDVPIPQALPTNTPLPSPTPFPTETPTEFPTPTSAAEFPVFAPTATSEFNAFSAEASPTEAPAVAQLPTQSAIDPFAQTATVFVLGATMTLESQLTGTAQALGIGFPPTETPTAMFVATNAPGTTIGSTLPNGDCIHEVRAEDRNLYRISLLYGVPVVDIAAASGITNINLITVGEKLTIPGCGTTGVTPPPTSTPQSTPTPFGFTATITGQTTVATPVVVTGGRTHYVQQGETLFEISLMYGVPVADIAAANGITNIDLIYLGQELVIP